MTFLECSEKKECGTQGRITPAQAHELKLLTAAFAESTAMLEWAKKKGNDALEVALAERDRTRSELYSFIDSLVAMEE